MKQLTLAAASLAVALLSAGCGAPSEDHPSPVGSQEQSVVSPEHEGAGLDEHVGRLIRENGITGAPAARVARPPASMVELGRALFFDRILGGETNVACASCHHPATSSGDGLRLPRGVGSTGVGAAREAMPGFRVPRNAPPVWNANLFNVQFADGRVSMVDPLDPTRGCATPDGTHLDVSEAIEAQAMFPVTSHDEMRGSFMPDATTYELRAALAARVAAVPAYREMFARAFGDEGVDPARMARAIAAYEASLQVVDTPWFAYVRGRGALSEEARRGAVVFYEVARCQGCHAGDMGTDLGFHNIAMPQFGPGKGNGPDGHDDFGRENVTHLPADRYRFRTPTLVNVARHAPYGHDGAYLTLEAVVRHHLDVPGALARYGNDGGALEPEFIASLRDHAPRLATLDPLLRPSRRLADRQVSDLLAFLEAQTDPRTSAMATDVPESVPSGLPVDR